MRGAGRAPWRAALAAALALGLAAAAGADEPAAPGATGALRVVQDRVSRLGAFLLVDAIVENTTAGPIEAAEVSVEFSSFFDELLGVEHAVLGPASLGPGQKASFRVATPFSEAIRKIRYRFTWRAGGEQLQNRPEAERPVWR